MRNEFEEFLLKLGAYFALSLLSVLVTKMFSDKKETFKTVLRSCVACLLITTMIVAKVKDPSDFSGVIGYVILGGICSDIIWLGLMKFGPSIISLITKGGKL